MLKKFEDKMQKSYENMTSEFMAIRAGRANPHVLDKVTVDYYGVPTPVAAGGQCLCSRSTHDPDPAMGAESARRDRESDHDV